MICNNTTNEMVEVTQMGNKNEMKVATCFVCLNLKKSNGDNEKKEEWRE